jgi:cobalamin biosynthetic protein CobC
MLEHGGRLRSAAAHWDIPLAEWLDLSTGIAPWSYPVRIDESAWRRLPEDDDELVAAAADYYGHPQPLPLPGSQAAIRELPRLLAPWRRRAVSADLWRVRAGLARGRPRGARAGAAEALMDAGDADVVMLANPNNPGRRHALRRSPACPGRAPGRARRLAGGGRGLRRHGAGRGAGAAGRHELPRLVVLRSLGKFFGLAGARVGFLCAAPDLSARLAEALGPWAVAHPAASRRPRRWAIAPGRPTQRERLMAATLRLRPLLGRYPGRRAPAAGFSVTSHGAGRQRCTNTWRGAASCCAISMPPKPCASACRPTAAEWRRLDAALDDDWKPT